MLIVQHGYHSFKAATTPQTLLVQVRDDACHKWNLEPTLYALSWNGKPLDLTCPQRFTSLVNGAKLDLIKSTTTQSRVKLRHSAGEWSGTFPSTTKIAEMLAAAGVEGDVFLGQNGANPQSSLAQLGVQGSVVFAVRPAKAPTAPEPVEMAPIAAPTATPSAPLSVPSAPSPAAQTATSEPSVSLTNTQRPLGALAVPPPPTLAYTQPPSAPTVAQARAYMDHLYNQAQPKPLLFRSTREKLRQEKRSQQKMTIRIRLPDMSLLEGVFSPQESGEHVYDFIRTYLLDPALGFSLESVPPGFSLLPSHSLLETPFDARVMLSLKTPTPLKGPFLNEKARAQAQAQTETLVAELAKAKAAANGQPEETAPPAPAAQPSTSAPKKPKWLKLGKN